VAISVPIKRPRPLARVRRVGRDMRRQWTAYLFLSPGLVLFFTFTLFSIIFSFYLSFHEWNILDPAKPYVGLENYRDLAEDDRFGRAVINTAYFTFASIPLTMALGLGVALLLDQQIRARGLFRTLYYLPVITPLVVASIIWKWVYNADYGFLNYYLQQAGIIDHPLFWLSDKNLAMPAVIGMNVWKGVGFDMVVFLAGLQAIPSELYEAAKVDGAGAWQRFRRITLPLLSPTVMFLIIIGVIFSFQVFTQIFVMTNGGPVDRTTTIVYYMYITAFKFFEMGYATAIAYALFAMMFVFTLLQLRFYRREFSWL
jgi:multiple sugar transport system permease protein